MKRRIRMWGAMFMTFVFCYLLLLIYPSPLFANKYQYRNFTVYADTSISKHVELVIDDSIRRLEKSVLYASDSRFEVFLCNADWRFALLTRNTNAGGVVNFLLSPNIFIRKNNLELNQLIPPHTWTNSLADRPLSYFIAHEATHSLQRGYDHFLLLRAPIEIIEGYADYIAKSGTFNLATLKNAFRANDLSMNPKNGLYDKYHLYVGYLIEEKGYDFEMLVSEQPEMAKTLDDLIRGK